MGASVDRRWSYEGHEIVRLENAVMRVDVVPGMGGKILHLIDKRFDVDVLWRNPRLPLRVGPLHASFDDYFNGGWDDAFPTAQPCLNEYGDQLPYLGEIWNLPLEATTSTTPDGVAVRLEGLTPITPARWTRTILMTADEPLITLRTEIENVGPRSFSYILGSHPTLEIGPDTSVEVPARHGTVTEAGEGRLGSLGARYEYPWAGDGEQRWDVRHTRPPATADFALHALSGLEGGWAAAVDRGTGRGLGLSFDRSTFTSVWQWMSYGGCRGWYHLALEPWTSPVPSLQAATEAGLASRLEPGESVTTEIVGALLSVDAGRSASEALQTAIGA